MQDERGCLKEEKEMRIMGKGIWEEKVYVN